MEPNSEGFGTAQEIFDFYAGMPADDPFWEVVDRRPGPDLLFDIAIYYRGAMTLHALRLEVGDEDFFRILRRWVASQAGGNVTTDEFIAAGRARLRSAAGRAVRRLAVHTGEAGGPGGGSGPSTERGHGSRVSALAPGQAGRANGTEALTEHDDRQPGAAPGRGQR